MNIEEYTLNIYVNNKPQPVIHIVKKQNNTVVSVGKILFEPLFNNIYLTWLNLPTRKQIHSKVYYLTKHHTLSNSIYGSTEKELLEQAKEIVTDILKNEHQYFSNGKEDYLWILP